MATLSEVFTNIANAIRGRTGKTATMTPAEMAIEISKLSDTSADTVTAAKMLSGTKAHDKAGNAITGTIATKTASNMTASGATVTAPAGYYASAASKSVATATQATPSISVDSAGKITASATQSAGYVSAGTKSSTKQLSVQAAQTITPGTTDKTIASGKYLTGTQTIKGDANLIAENIKSGVSIFGVEGTMEAGDGGSPALSVTFVNNTSTLIVCGAAAIPAGGSCQLFLMPDERYAEIGMTVYYCAFVTFGVFTDADLICQHKGVQYDLTYMDGTGMFNGTTLFQFSLTNVEISDGDIVEVRSA